MHLVSRGNNVGLKSLEDRIGKSYSTLHEHVSDLDSEGYLDVSGGDGRPLKMDLSRSGYQVLFESVGAQQPIGYLKESDEEGSGEVGDVCLHNFSVKVPIKNNLQLADGWRERWVQGKTQRYTWDSTNDSYVYWIEDWRFRITGENVVVRLDKEIRSDSAHRCKNIAMDEVMDALDWLESNSPVKVLRRPKDFEIHVNRQHLAIEDDPFYDLVENYSDVSPSDVRIYDEDGSERLWLDNSNGDKHLEAGNAPGENKDFAEDDIDFIRNQVYRFFVDGKEDWETVKQYPEDRKVIMSCLLALLNSNVYSDQEHGTNTEGTSGLRERTISDEFSVTSKWVDSHGNLMGWVEEAGKPVKLVDKEEMP